MPPWQLPPIFGIPFAPHCPVFPGGAQEDLAMVKLQHAVDSAAVAATLPPLQMLDDLRAAGAEHLCSTSREPCTGCCLLLLLLSTMR